MTIDKPNVFGDVRYGELQLSENSLLANYYLKRKKFYYIAAYTVHILLVLFLIVYFIPFILYLCNSSFPEMTLKGPVYLNQYSRSDREYYFEKVHFSQTQYNGDYYVSNTTLEFKIEEMGLFYVVEYSHIDEGKAFIDWDNDNYCLKFSTKPLSSAEENCDDISNYEFTFGNTSDANKQNFYISFLRYSPIRNNTYDPLDSQAIISVPLIIDATLASNPSNFFATPISLFIYSIVGIIVCCVCFPFSVILQGIAVYYRRKLKVILSLECKVEIELPPIPVDPFIP